jgi:hypothetical protein
MQSLKKAAGNDQNLYQRLVNAIDRAGSDRSIPPGGASGLATEGGPSRGTGTKVDPNQPLRSQGAGSVSGNRAGAKLTEDLTDAQIEKLVERYPEWDNIKDYIGRAFDPNNPPPGYRSRKPKPGSNKPELVRDNKQGAYPPLTVENGIIYLQTGKTNRLSVYSRYKKNYLEWVEQTQGKAARTAVEQRVANGNQLHHLVPDAVVSRHELTRELMKKSKTYTLDRGTNILDMPTAHDPKTGEIVHLGSHQKFNDYVQQLLDRKVRDLTQGRIKPLDTVDVKALDKALREVEDTLRIQIRNRTLPPEILEILEGGGLKLSEEPRQSQGGAVA